MPPALLSIIDSSRLSLTLDCSALPLEIASREPQVQALLEWVRSLPRRDGVRITLRSPLMDKSSRALKNTLQALGCRVTTKSVFVG